MDQWYAWTHLIPPATAARNITERHLRIMDSYVSAPQVHASAVKNPKLQGGPFIDYDGKRVAEIAALRDETKRTRMPLLRLSAAIAELDGLLCAKAKGFSLSGLYSQVPEALKGYVELCYDLNNQPSFRIIEPLLYQSRYYDRSAQSLMLSITSGDGRSFVLSTPRLEGTGLCQKRVPFDDPFVDDLFRLERAPRPWCEVRDLFGGSLDDPELVQSFFTTEPPPKYEHYTNSGVRWRYFGHGCILIEAAGVSILFDPVISYSYETDLPRYTYCDLPEHIDYVVVTHNHQDHILLETLLRIRHKVGMIVVPRSGNGALQDPSVRLALTNIGFTQVVELSELESIKTPAGEIVGLPFLGEHADLNVASKLGYMVRIGRHKIMILADSCNIEPRLYDHVRALTGPVDAIFLGMECAGAPLSWLYGPLITRSIERAMDESRRLAGSDFEQGIRLVDCFQCKDAYVYAMGQEPWLNHVMSIKYTPQSKPITESDRFVAACRERGVRAERLFGEKEILLEP